MADFLLELFSEEIPARMQARAAEDLQRLVTEGMTAAGLDLRAARRNPGRAGWCCISRDCPPARPTCARSAKARASARRKRRWKDFCGRRGCASLDECETRDDGKGEFYVAVIKRPGRPAADIVASVVPEVIRKFPWPKSMRWGSWKAALGASAAFDPLRAGRRGGAVRGGGYRERRHHPWPSAREDRRGRGLTVQGFADYAAKLKAANVVLARAERIGSIAEQARQARREGEAGAGGGPGAGGRKCGARRTSSGFGREVRSGASWTCRRRF